MRSALMLSFAFLVLIFGTNTIQAQDHQPDRIVVIGDLHGDYEAYREIVSQAGLSKRAGRWTGGRTTLIQMGDIVDRGPDSLAIIEDLRELARNAPRRGGQVIILIGNHEAMNVIGDLRYVDPGEYAAFTDRNSEARREIVYEANREAIEAFYATAEQPLTAAEAREAWFAEYPLGKVEHRLAWGARGELGTWAGQLPATALINGTLFVHGGLSAEYAVYSLEDLNRMVREAVSSTEGDPASILEDPLGPLWYRGNIFRDEAEAEELGLAPEGGEAVDEVLCENPCQQSEGELEQDSEPDTTFSDNPCLSTEDSSVLEQDDCEDPRLSIEEELDVVLSTYGADRMVVAHTPSLQGIVSREDGRLIRADTGISSFYGGPYSYLELYDGRAIAWSKRSGEDWERQELPASGREELP